MKNQNNLVVKDNALINAAYRLSLSEQRLLLLSIIEARARNIEIDETCEIEISAQSYMDTFNLTRQSSYEALEEAARRLIDRKFSYYYISKGKNLRKVVSNWVQHIDYSSDEATVKLAFSLQVVPLISSLEKQFTSYEINKVASLSSIYAIRLYELLMSWKSAGKTPIYELEKFRDKMGLLDNEYMEMHNLKKRVLTPAITQINKHTDVTVDYEQHKKGRNISGFSFTFSYKKDAQATSKRCSKTIDFVDEQNLTAKQLGYYAKLLARSHWATQARVLQGVNANDAVSVLMSHLKQHSNFEKRKALIAELVKEDQHKLKA